MYTSDRPDNAPANPIVSFAAPGITGDSAPMVNPKQMNTAAPEAWKRGSITSKTDADMLES